MLGECVFFSLGVHHFSLGFHQKNTEHFWLRTSLSLVGFFTMMNRIPTRLWGGFIYFDTIYLYTWNPNDLCFDWSLGLLLQGSKPKIEDNQVPGIDTFVFAWNHPY